jgi:hypothetical protein
MFTSIIINEMCLRKVARTKGSAEHSLNTTSLEHDKFFFALKPVQKIKSHKLFAMNVSDPSELVCAV